VVSGSNKISPENIKVAFLLLCHGKVANIVKLLSIDYFDNSNLKIYIHYDKKQSRQTVDELKAFVKTKSNVHFVEKRVSCGWGEYSLVEATLNMMEVAVNDNTFTPDYLFLMSAACHPTKPFESLRSFLSENYGKEFIEANDHRYVKWIEGGWDKERTWYYFPFNYNTEREMYQYLCDYQEKKGIKRELPIDLNLQFGSQWFCLTKKTCEGILKIMSDKKLVDFFRLCWIPDEFLIQSLTVKVAGLENVPNRNLTFYQFNSFGRPLVMYNDHIEFVDSLDYFFVRKVADTATILLEHLSKVSSSELVTNTITLENVGKRPMDFKVKQQKYLSNEYEIQLGRIKDKWNEGIIKNKKRYHVLTGPCKYLIHKMIDEANRYDNLTVFNYIFDRKELTPSNIHEPYKGVSKLDFNRRNMDSIAFLNQIIHADTNEVCFALDPDDDPDHIREVVRWDVNASVMIVEPHWRNKTERAISYLTAEEAESLLKFNMYEIPDLIKEMIKKKRKFYWLNLMKNPKDHKASISWLEDNKGYFSEKMNHFKYKFYQHTYLPQKNVELYELLLKQNISVDI